MISIRPIKASDLPGLKEVLDHCELFPSAYLDDMIADYLTNEDTEHIWFTADDHGQVLSLAYCAPMQFTNGTYNLYAIGVHEDFQGRGIGTDMMAYLEELLREQGHRVLIVETSSTDDLAASRAFYEARDYQLQATIPDFWDENDHKVVYWKKLTSKY